MRLSALPRQKPYWVGEIDLAGSLEPIPVGLMPGSGRPYGRARLLVRLQGEPLTMLNLTPTNGVLPPEAVLEATVAQAGDRMAAQVGPRWRQELGSLPELSAELTAVHDSDPPPVSVVIGTRNRAEHVAICVTRVLDQRYSAPIEVIVVDNGSASSATRDVIESSFGHDRRVRYIHEARSGLSRARNIGLAAATHPLVAFLSDDIQVDPFWLLAVARGFRRQPTVRCVVGYVPPLYLDTPEQLVFEATMAWGWRNGFSPFLITPEQPGDRLHPYRVGIGNGASIAFDTETLRSQGGFDERLGPGTPSRGGEDLDAPIRVLLGGGTVAFEPAALGWHADRYDDRGFATHMFTYGLGLTAFLTAHLLDARTRGTLLRRVPRGAAYLARPAILPPSSARLDRVQMPVRYRLANIVGRLVGPIAYLRSWWEIRRTSRRHPPSCPEPSRPSHGPAGSAGTIPSPPETLPHLDKE
jgi:glycosyltransferase involved in cell wall biosynthesis